MAVNKQEKHKEFRLSTLSINNKVSVYVLTVIILLMGYTAFNTMPKENFPEVVMPEIYVGTPYPGNSPLDIEKLITRPLEKEINAITGVDEISSTSVQGYSTIVVKFDFGIEPSLALQKVKDKIDIAMSDADFPKDLPADPNAFEMNFSELIPIMNINLSGNFSLEQLKEYGEVLEDKIEDIKEISKVDVRGVMDKEVKIELDLHLLESMELNFDDVAKAIQMENVSISGGDLLLDDYRRNVRIVGEFGSVSEIGDIIVKREKQNIVYLRDIADIKFEEEEKESYAREFKAPVVSLDIIKRAGENLLSASDKISAILKESKGVDYPDNLNVTITSDQSDMTRNQVDELLNSIIFGVILVVFVLLFFLGLRNALFVGIAIPLSMLLSFAILSAMGVTMNVMVLFSLVLALGMLVDNGIVVVENVYRLMSEGYGPIKAARYGVGEVALPIIASTATTLAVFLPLAMWPGQMGEFMKYLPITLMIVLSSSLFVALVINPVLTSVLMKVEVKKSHKRRALIGSLILISLSVVFMLVSGISWFTSLLLFSGIVWLLNTFALEPASFWFQDHFLPKLENGYEVLLSYWLKGWRPVFLFFGMITMLVASIMIFALNSPKVLFFPENEPRYVNVFLELPIGSDIEASNRLAKEVEIKVIDAMTQYEEVLNGEKVNYMVTSVLGQVGNGTSDPQEGPSMSNTPNKARISVSFVEAKLRRGISTMDVMEEIRLAVGSYPGVQVTVSKDPAGPPQGAAISLEIGGDNYQELIIEADRIKSFINEFDIAGIEQLKLDVKRGKPELPIEIDRDKARRFDLSTAQIGDVLRTSLFGKEVSTYKEGEDDYPIMVRLKDQYRYNLDNLMNQKITFRNNMTGNIHQVPISAVATAKRTTTFSAVKRKDLTRVITITSGVLEGFNATEIVDGLKEIMLDYEMPDNVSYSFTGQQEKQAEEMSFLTGALMIAIFLIFLIMVTQFNSVISPFIIMFSVIFSLIGVLLGLVIFEMDFVVIMHMIGIISLAGIVVNNAIVLMDYTDLVRERKKEELGLKEKKRLPLDVLMQSIVHAGKTRLRPVLLTAITTILGLLPLALGINIDFFTLMTELDPNIFIGGDNVIFWGPMSWAIIFGLTFATFLTLIVVPVMYYLSDKITYKVLKIFKKL